MTWHSGHSLSQTLFTCMYFHHVLELNSGLFINNSNYDSTQDPNSPIEFVILVLKAYVLGTVKCSHLVWDEMTKGNVYEVRYKLIILECLLDINIILFYS